jgi:catechol 2,3-dioxygenase-like lactoylglutathione lyase family enzyme
MFDHIGIVASDFARSKAFYAHELAPISHSRVVENMVDGGLEPSAGFCHEDGSDLWISPGETT